MTDAVHELSVGHNFVPEVFDGGYNLRMGMSEFLPALRISSVKYGAVSKDKPSGKEHPVAICPCAAAHSGSIVHHYASYHGALDRSRIRSEFPAVRLQEVIYLGAHHTRLQNDRSSSVRSVHLLPVLSGNHQDRVTYSLS